MTSFLTCDLEPFRYQTVPQPVGDDGASANRLNEQQLENYLARLVEAICTDLQNSGGITELSFLELTDTPDSYTGASGQAVAVNAGETGLEFVDFPTPPPSDSLLTSRMVLIAHPDADGTGALLFGSGQPTTAGTIGVNNPSSTAGQFVETYPRTSMSTSAVAGQSSTWRTTTATVWRGNAARRGGFRAILRVGTQTALAQQRAFAGVKVPGTIGNVNPSTLTDCIGLAYDSAETTWRIQHNDNAGNCTRIDLGANFPVNNTALLELELVAAANGGDVTYTVTNLETGDSTTGTLSSNLPTATTAMELNFWVNNGTTAASAVMVWTFGYLEMAV